MVFTFMRPLLVRKQAAAGVMAPISVLKDLVAIADRAVADGQFSRTHAALRQAANKLTKVYADKMKAFVAEWRGGGEAAQGETLTEWEKGERAADVILGELLSTEFADGMVHLVDLQVPRSPSTDERNV